MHGPFSTSAASWGFPSACRVLVAGQNLSGELGLGLTQHTVREFHPLPFSEGGLLSAAACGGGYTVVTDARGGVWHCGDQDGGSTGLAKSQRVLTPVRALSGVKVAALASGLSHSLAMTDDGLVFAWGRNADGQCGATLDCWNVCAPRVVEGLRQRWSLRIAAGGYHSLVVTAVGGKQKEGCTTQKEGGTGGKDPTELFAFGWNNYGQCGVSSASAIAPPHGAGDEDKDVEQVFIDAVNNKIAQPQRVQLPADLYVATVSVSKKEVTKMRMGCTSCVKKDLHPIRFGNLFAEHNESKARNTHSHDSL